MGQTFAASLNWEEKGAHPIYGTERCAFAAIPVLEHSVGRAGFEVFHNNDGGWRCIFWHGNRGHMIAWGLTSRRMAESAAQCHANKLAAALVAEPETTLDNSQLHERLVTLK